ncbi:YfiR family protein [Thalassomonas viridans]|uniref:YfiR family protein n=1 Tax=Thalassomonas viridans TaxID=137584 RepID=A0AAE9Z2M1_9GAMM|nr:YfiR family protein [Thalassomonas viridans]WDE05107.1 YfiR family protein [Thalassomonas viridans]
MKPLLTLTGLLLCCLCLKPFLSVAATTVTAENEESVKAAMLLKFPLFVYWPKQVQTKRQRLGLCVLGSKNLKNALYRISLSSDQAYHFYLLDKISELSDSCHILFIDKSKRALLSYILGQVQNKPVLTVSDIDDFAESGGIIQISNIGSRLTIEINIDAAVSADLKISSVLLNLSQ